mgnify:CR=1 FL=1
MADITPQERFRGCLLAGAAGDALGAPVEFMPRADILRHFGTAGITAFALGYERVGAITDDTQMTLFTAAGLLAAWCGDGDVVRATARSYLAWLRTQDEWPYDPLLAAEEPSGWLWQQPELHHRRAPGMTCLTALSGMPVLGALAQNNSKGCGGVMRMAPVGLYAAAQRWSPAQTFQTGTALATLTHGHPAGSLTAGVLAVLVQALCAGETLADGLARAKPLLRARAGEVEQGVADWWTAFQEADEEQRKQMIQAAEQRPDSGDAPAKKRRRRRKKKTGAADKGVAE